MHCGRFLKRALCDYSHEYSRTRWTQKTVVMWTLFAIYCVLATEGFHPVKACPQKQGACRCHSSSR